MPDVVNPGSSAKWARYGDIFLLTGETVEQLPSGLYEPIHTAQGVGLKNIKLPDVKVFDTKDDIYQRVMKEMTVFWSKADKYKSIGLSHKRGYLFHGAPGTGKTTLVRLLMNYVFDLNGVAIRISESHMFENAYTQIRNKQYDTPILAILEDIDSLIFDMDEPHLLNLLDGLQEMHKVVFVATTNFPENIGERFLNRPGRFDGVYKIDHPKAEVKKSFILEFLKSANQAPTEVDKWTRAMEDRSMAHIKELLVSVVVLGVPFDEAQKTLDEQIESVENIIADAK